MIGEIWKVVIVNSIKTISYKVIATVLKTAEATRRSSIPKVMGEYNQILGNGKKK